MSSQGADADAGASATDASTTDASTAGSDADTHTDAGTSGRRRVGRASSRRLAFAIIAMVVLLPILGIISYAVWGGAEHDVHTELPQGSGGGFGG